MAFAKIIVLFVGFFLLGTPGALGHPRPARSSPDLRERLGNLRDAVEVLETTVDIAYNGAKDSHCDNNVCPTGFLEGLGNPLCKSRLAPSNYTMTIPQIESDLVTSQLSLKLWNCVLEPVLEDLGPDYLGDENDTGLDNIPEGVRQVQRTIRSLGIPQAEHVRSTPCSLVLLRTFKRHLTSVRLSLSVMRTGMQAHAQ
ncbi:Hypp1904 [Branchiostoma lanceolatum]|uniref:Hypp1904 protein n=1 Tax=Branchiostoma lanceolatum TaxID=7740 RepID=A0A8J9ZLX8_BRALA|nr:Hypp1904 [Branchiostoma lanceolatum]